MHERTQWLIEHLIKHVFLYLIFYWTMHNLIQSKQLYHTVSNWMLMAKYIKDLCYFRNFTYASIEFMIFVILRNFIDNDSSMPYYRYENIGAKSRYFRQGYAIAFHSILWYAITYPYMRYLPLSPKS